MEDIYIPNTWLQQIGFKLGNPFSTREASRELDPELVNYFIHHTSFDDVLGNAKHPESTFLIAGRGCGKTTTRRAIEWSCRAGRPNGFVLTIPYLEFTEPLRHADNSGKVSVEHHINNILREGIPLLLERFANEPDYISNLTLSFKEQLAAYLEGYTTLRTNIGLDTWLYRIGYHGKNINAHMLKSTINRQHEPFLRFLAELITMPIQLQEFLKGSHLDKLSQLIIFSELAGYEAIYVLIDRVDEQEPMASNPNRAAKLLEALVTNLHIMEFEKTAFKLFITPSVMDELKFSLGLRLDRLTVRHLNWSEDELQQLLDMRVKVYSDDKWPSLDAVCAPDLVGLVSKMAVKANGSPRNILRFAEWLLFWHQTRTIKSDAILLTQEDYIKAVESFEKETDLTGARSGSLPTGLWIDEASNIWRNKEKLGRFTKNQQRLLEHLIHEKGNVCSYDSLCQAVYGEREVVSERGVSDERIDQLIKRIRKLVEKDSSQPEYIVKVPGKGYILEQ